MKLKSISLFFAANLFFSPVLLHAQVQVSKEPRHKVVLENKYFRVLDVWLQPGDTSLFHIHSTPSVFLHFTNTATGSQVKGRDWENGRSVAGNAWYNSFSPDILVHRVCNRDTVPFHVNDIEILASWNRKILPERLPFNVLFENEKVVAYRLTGSSFTKAGITNRGPVIALLTGGDEIQVIYTSSKKSTRITRGKFLYIEPGISLDFLSNGNKEINLVIFEFR